MTESKFTEFTTYKSFNLFDIFRRLQYYNDHRHMNSELQKFIYSDFLFTFTKYTQICD